MRGLPAPIANLIDELGQLPGIGPKSAQRLAFYIAGLPSERLERLIGALRESKEGLLLCASCHVLTDSSPCSVCADPDRDRGTICVVQDTRDVAALERMQVYHGLYHVLGGLISPMDGLGPDDIRVRELLARLADQEVRELIIATNSSVEGDATALYIARLAKTFDGLTVTRIAHGLPIGGELEYADEVTLARALEYRHPF